MSQQSSSQPLIAVSCPPKHKESFSDLIQSLQDRYRVALNLEDVDATEVDCVLCIGGDGSLNHLVNSSFFLDAKSEIDVLYLPNGTANDFARSLKLKFPAILLSHQVHDVIKSDYKVKVPVLTCNDRYFLNVASVGLPAQVTESGDSSIKDFSGVIGYYLSAMSVALSDKKFSFHFAEDQQEEYARETFGFFVSQGLYAGGGVKVSGSFNPNFGERFNFLIPRSSEKLDALIAASKIQNENAEASQVEIDSKFLNSLTVRSDEPIPVKLDGEEYQAKTLKFGKTDRFLNFFLY